MTAVLKWGVRTDPGRIRQQNEDSVLVDANVFAVADGMGGHKAGEVASGEPLVDYSLLVKARFTRDDTDNTLDLKLGFSEGDLPFSGQIKGIDPKIDPASRLVNVRAEVANPEGKLTPGQFVQVRVELPKEDGVLALPQTALTTSLYGDYVFVVRPAKAKDTATEKAAEKPADTAKPAEAKPEEKPAADAAKPAEGEKKPDLVLAQVFVKPGRHNDGLVEILSGIVAGDEVVTAGQNRLFNGMSVVIDNTIDPTKSLKPQAPQQ